MTDKANCDVLYGLEAISAHLGMTARQAKHRIATGSVPTFKMDLGRTSRAGLVADIRAGVIRNVSVGYAVHAAQRFEGRGDAMDKIVVTDWEPLEISAVPIPADPGAQLRSFT